MERYDGVPGPGGSSPVWVTSLPSVRDWRALLEDEDWDRLVERERRKFGLFTVSADPQAEKAGWIELADHLVSLECVLTCSWGAGSSLLDDLVDESVIARSVVRGLPSAEPMTTWHDDEPLADALELFLGVDFEAPDRERFVLVVGQASWLEEVRVLLSSAEAP